MGSVTSTSNALGVRAGAATNSTTGIHLLSRGCLSTTVIRSSVTRSTFGNRGGFRGSNDLSNCDTITNVFARTYRVIMEGSSSVGDISSLLNGAIDVNRRRSNSRLGTGRVLSTCKLGSGVIGRGGLGCTSTTGRLRGNRVSTTFFALKLGTAIIRRLSGRYSVGLVKVSSTTIGGLGGACDCISYGVPGGACGKRDSRINAITMGTILVIGSELSIRRIGGLARLIFSGTRRLRLAISTSISVALRGTIRNIGVPFRGNTTRCCSREKVAMGATKWLQGS